MSDDLAICEIHVRLTSVSGVNCSYAPNDVGSFRRRVVLEGHVDRCKDEHPRDGAPTFGGAKIAIEIHTGPDSLELGKYASQEGVKSVCGSVKIMANVEPECFDDDDAIFLPPIQVSLIVEESTFDRLEKHLADADRRNQIVGGSIVLSGTSLPDKGGIWRQISPQELIASETRTYAVIAFDIDAYRQRRILVNRIMSPSNRSCNQGDRCHLSIGLSEIKFSLDMERGQITEITCIGRVHNKGKCYDNAEASVTFREHDRQGIHWEYPAEADAGEFYLCPPKPDECCPGYYASVDLRFTQEDAREFLTPLLIQGSNYNFLSLKIVILASDDELASASESLTRAITSYQIEATRIVSPRD